jgi:hypothetical protein
VTAYLKISTLASSPAALTSPRSFSLCFLFSRSNRRACSRFRLSAIWRTRSLWSLIRRASWHASPSVKVSGLRRSYLARISWLTARNAMSTSSLVHQPNALGNELSLARRRISMLAPLGNCGRVADQSGTDCNRQGQFAAALSGRPAPDVSRAPGSKSWQVLTAPTANSQVDPGGRVSRGAKPRDSPVLLDCLKSRFGPSLHRIVHQHYPTWHYSLKEQPKNNFPIPEGDNPIFAARKSGQFPSCFSAVVLASATDRA